MKSEPQSVCRSYRKKGKRFIPGILFYTQGHISISCAEFQMFHTLATGQGLHTNVCLLNHPLKTLDTEKTKFLTFPEDRIFRKQFVVYVHSEQFMQRLLK